MADRRYSDKEVSAIIQKATALQMGGSADKSGGATLTQIQQAAQELGIAPELVERAAEECNTQPVRARNWFVGSTTHCEHRMTVEGQLSEKDWTGVLHEIRRITGRVGTPTTVGDAFEWKSENPDGLHVSLTPLKGKTHVDVLANLSNWTALYFVIPLALSFAFGVGASAAAIKGSGLIFLGPIVFMLIQLLCWMTGRAFYARVAQRRVREVQELANRLQDYVESEATLSAKSMNAIAETSLHPMLQAEPDEVTHQRT